jgi:predicted  nucleic acid-binding Zn-ribbon protein
MRVGSFKMAQLFWFYRCYHCGTWYYSSRRIETKQCIKCNKRFFFEKSKKLKRKCTQREAISIIKELKEPQLKELIQLVDINTYIRRKKKRRDKR